MKVVNLKKEKYDVYIGRGSKWGNPFSHLDNSKALYRVSSRNEAIEKYENWIRFGDGKYLLDDLHELENKILGCYCYPKKCHGEVLLKLLKEKEYSQMFE
jgi:hypothetical protein